MEAMIVERRRFNEAVLSSVNVGSRRRHSIAFAPYEPLGDTLLKIAHGLLLHCALKVLL